MVKISRLLPIILLMSAQSIFGETFVVMNTNNAGADSLRQAILDANGNADPSNIINFNIPGIGPHTIQPASPLPTITKPITIDGYSEPGAQVATVTAPAILQIEIDGQNAGAGADGLTLGAGSDGSTIRGLVINRFDDEGILIQSSNNKILGNHIGTNVAGTAALSNGDDGVDIENTNGNIIGGTNPADRNVISGNTSEGIELNGSNNQVIGNYIGTNAAGTGAIPNGEDGIDLSDGDPLATNNIIEKNIIAFNTAQGIDANAGSSNNIIRCNRIFENGSFGVQIDGANSDANSILANSIFDNGANGIELTNGGNNNQAAPVITAATASSQTIKVSGTLNSLANRTFRIEFFVNTVNNNPITEGRTFVGFVNVTTDNAGLAQFNNVRLLSSATVGQFVSATATLLQNSSTLETSEYSLNRVFTQGLSESALSVAIFTKYCSNNDNPCE